MGCKSFQKFNGEWSFAILDKKNNEVIICRDGIGYKPCYIFDNNNFFAFSSEIKAFYALENKIEFDNNNLGINSTTLNNCSKTIFKNVNQLTQGRYLKINLNNLEKKYLDGTIHLKIYQKSIQDLEKMLMIILIFYMNLQN